MDGGRCAVWHLYSYRYPNGLNGEMIIDIDVGLRLSSRHTIGDDEVRAFAELTGDVNPIHLDDASAGRSRFGRRVAHGVLSLGFISKIIGTQLAPAGATAIYLEQSVRFLKPVFVGDTITCAIEVTAVDRDKRIVTLETTAKDEVGALLLSGEARILIDPDPFSS